MSNQIKDLVMRLNSEVRHERLVRFYASEHDFHVVAALRNDTFIEYPYYDIERNPVRFFSVIKTLIEFVPEGGVFKLGSNLWIVDVLADIDKSRKRAEERADEAERRLDALDISADHIGHLIGQAKKAMEDS